MTIKPGNIAPNLTLWLYSTAFPVGITFFLLFFSCQPQPSSNSPKLFTLLPSDSTGISFSNTLTEDLSFNMLNYLYFYNGGGIAVGDVNNDGWQDLYFTANQQSNKLYLNRGDFQFEDITASAGVAGLSGWATGTNMADVNGDGWIDIYVCQVGGGYEGIQGRNQLYLNQGIDANTGLPIFKEVAEEVGLAFEGFSTQSAFFDYDRDGDLDMYLLNHSVHANDTYRDTSLRRQRHPTAGDRLYRNDTPLTGNGSLTFTEVGQEAGIYSSALGYGLGIAIGDLNRDGWPDIYIGNDFHENDYLYFNQGDGTFSEQLQTVIGHTSQFSMGVDIADINQDTWPDILTLDMKPDREDILKTSEPPNSYDIFQFKLSYGFTNQYPHNALQLNYGATETGTPSFGEISQYAGIDATDWSWSALLADYDLDGHKDVYISNGIFRRPNDMDYINFISEPVAARSLNQGISQENFQFIQRMPQVKIAGFAYRNERDYRFSNQTTPWGLDQPAFSNGAVYADLDNDGDLDLVVNNINESAFVYRNEAQQQLEHHALTITLEGEGKNPQGIGAAVLIRHKGLTIFQENFPVKGFQSSVSPLLTIGTGSLTTIDSLCVIWPDQRVEWLTNISTAKPILLQQQNATSDHHPFVKSSNPQPLLTEITDETNVSFRHRESGFVDFNRETLMPHMLSNLGPRLAYADVNGDGRQDVYVGGAGRQAGALFLGKADGTYEKDKQVIWQQDSIYEDTDALFIDVDNDGDSDLFVVSGGNEFRGKYAMLKDRLYINEGKGKFIQAPDRLPEMYENGGCVAAGDMDQDGDMDLFVGGRVVAGYYGQEPRSYLLQNDGNGHFQDVTESQITGLSQIGMVSDADWADVDGDDRLDLILVGEWMPITLWLNKKKGWKSATVQAGLGKTNGWWNKLLVEDMDGDGDIDIVAGNLGLNSHLKASEEEPCTLYLNDFDQNGSIDPILCYYKHGVSYPMATKDELISQLAPLRKKYLRYSDYANSTIEDIFPAEQLQRTPRKYVYHFAHTYFENQGDGTFNIYTLPPEAQFSPVYGMATLDVNQDGIKDLLVGGNQLGVGPNRGRYDAGKGLLLLGEGNGKFLALPSLQSGIFVEGQIRDIQLIGPDQIWMSINNGRPKIFKLNAENTSW